MCLFSRGGAMSWGVGEQGWEGGGKGRRGDSQEKAKKKGKAQG